MRGSFRLPLVDVRIALAPTGVRLLAALTLVAGAATVGAVALSTLPVARAPLETPMVVALSALTVLSTVLPLIDGMPRPLAVGIPSFALALAAAVAAGSGAEWPAPLLSVVLVVLCGCTIVYHLLGRASGERAR